ncbi:hypothetical protein BCR39DRAFT_534017 [Naematelia encephala]|uniref:Zn(2)-C6 fungal-type domain-containing protein n=1 Tax=Naematelia encephala TaxID=71784 RepID=A0A1Y2B1V1_9TREE|nr:hypothetical protein BCR39DRAFT_534017 [Naematelia encephala]
MPPKSNGGGGAGAAGASSGGRTCDNCRKRKIKCIEEANDHVACQGCHRLGLECTHDYIKKKPGRKNSFALAWKAAQNGDDLKPLGAHRSPQYHNHQSMSFPYPPIGTVRPPELSHHTQSNVPPPPFGLLSPMPPSNHSLPDNHPTNLSSEYSVPSHASSSTMAQASPGRPPSSFAVSSFAFSPSVRGPNDMSFNWLDSLVEPSGGGWFAGPDFNLDGSSAIPTQYVSDQAQLLSLESPEHLLTSASSSNTGSAKPHTLPVAKREPQLEDVTSWANISHFISLFLQFLYPLLPLVHRPTFAEHLATRRDLRDTDFRALLLSIVAYVISQLPTSRLVNDQFNIEGLKQLQRRCHRTCKSLQRTYYGPTNLTQICTIIFDTFYLLSIGLGHTAGARLGQAIQLAFSMGMHSDAKTTALGLDAIEIQLRRRVFWQLYASDKTRAIPGSPMLINDFQGVCSLPEPTDDDFITSQGMFPQPPSRPSVIAGFVCLSRVFRILSESFFHHRCILSNYPSVSTEWTVDAEDRLHKILREMPLAIQDPGVVSVEGTRNAFAMQRANILITAAICKFALYDLRAALNVDDDELAKERENIAREIHSLLMNIPVEDLASNGESVRGKVFHIACALCAQSPGNHADQELIKDWCNMFSAISFVQMPPPPPDAALDSRANSPPVMGPPPPPVTAHSS